MSDQQNQAPTVQITFPSGNLPPAIASNHFWVFYLGTDVEIVFGFADIPSVVQRREEAVKKNLTEFTYTPEAVSRIVVSKDSFRFLVNQIQNIAKQLGFDATDVTG
jgi:hypothetical protein